MMKEKKRLIVVLLAFILAFTGIYMVKGAGNRVMAATLAEDGSFVALPYDEVTETNGIPVPTDATYSDWLFAGWFKDETCTINTAVRDQNAVSSNCYAKFVPKDVLSIKAQIGTEQEDDGAYIIRFVSSVDSLNYSQVGFEATYDGLENPLKNISKTVYEKIDSTSKSVEYEFNPKVVDTKSEYFITAKLSTSDKETNYTVQAFWVTLDGTKVYGASRCVSVNDGNTTAPVNVSFQVSEGAEIGDSLDVTYGDGNKGTAEVVDVDGTTVHTRIKLEGSASRQDLPSATRFEFKADSKDVGYAIYRNLYTKYTGANTYDTTWHSIYQGEGNENEFVIATDADLFGFAQLCKNADTEYFKDKTVYLGASIEVDEKATWPVATQFAGTFDGQNETISGIEVVADNNEEGYQGFFGTTTKDSMIQNIRLKDSSVTSSNGNVGSIVGKLGGSMDSVYSNATVASSASNVGGLVGCADSSAEMINNCWFEGNVECTTETATEMYVGGILGDMESGNIAIQNCLNSGEIKYTFGTDTDVQVNVAGIYGGDSSEAKIANTLNAGEVIVETASGETHSNGVDSIAVNASVIQDAVYATTESSKAINNDVTSVASTLLKGYTGYKHATDLGFSTKSNRNGYWVARAKDIPALKTFVNDGIDVAWYYETEGDTYTLTTAEQMYGLAAISQRKNFDGKVVKLGADITLNKGDAKTWNVITPSREWLSIGTEYCPFGGVFDGQGHTISGLYLNTDKCYQGLFGDASEDSVIKDFRIVNSYYKNETPSQGKIFAIGSVAGRTYGRVEKVYCDTILESNTIQTGGIVGRTDSKYKEVDDVKTYTSEATVNDCWFAGTINSSGDNAGHNGGIVGAIASGNSNVTNCLVTGEVSTKDSTYQPFTGGIIGLVSYNTNVNIVGSLNAGTVTTSNLDGAYDYSIVGRIRGNTDNGPATVSMTGVYGVNDNTGAYSVGGTNFVTVYGQAELSTNADEISGASAFSLHGLDFTDYWVAKEGTTPELLSFSEAGLQPSGTQPHTGWFNVGKDSHTIMTKADLYGLSELGQTNDFSGETILLGADITLNEGEPEEWEKKGFDGVKTWTPVKKTFQGIFDGQGHKLIGVYISVTGTNVGFFSQTETGSMLKNFSIVKSYVTTSKTGDIVIGSVAGHGRGSMDSVYSDADVVATGNYIGGLVANITKGERNIENCWYAGNIKAGNGSKYIGGIFAYTNSAVAKTIVKNCLYTGKINSEESSYIGGICGSLNNNNPILTVNNCLIAGEINALNCTGVGDVVGYNKQGTVTCNYVYTIANDYQDVGTGAVTGESTQCDPTAISGKDAFNMSALDFDEIWVAKEGTTPELQVFSSAEGQIPVTDTVPDTRWYNTTDTEFVIRTVREMYGLAKLVNAGTTFEGKRIKLGADIIFNEGNAEDWLDGKNLEGLNIWNPIGISKTNCFNGTFDGQGHTISGIYLDTTASCAGLFGWAGADSMLKSFRIINSYINAKHDFVGLVVAKGYGSIDSVYTNAIIKSENSYIGGIVGAQYKGGDINSISNCWFEGEIKGGTKSQYIGGIIGYATGASAHITVKQCLYSGSIESANETESYVGGICGQIYKSNLIQMTMNDCLIAGNIQVKNATSVGALVGNKSGKAVTCDSVYTLSSDYPDIGDDKDNTYATGTFSKTDLYGAFAHTKLTGLDFVNYWVAKEDAIPELQTFSKIAGSINVNKATSDDSWYADAETDKVFTITTVQQLYGLAKLSNDDAKNFDGWTIKLGKDIYLNEGDATAWSENAPLNTWTPIGKTTAFAGTFDGQGHKISGIYINETSSNNVGLFAQTAVGSTIKNLAITNSYITSKKHYVGSVAGVANGTFDTIYSDAIIETTQTHTGGIGGTTNAGTENKFVNCWFNGSITGTETSAYYMGGISASVLKGAVVTMENCLNSGNISCSTTQNNSVVGGLCANTTNSDTKLTITNCIFNGTIECSKKYAVGTAVGWVKGTTEAKVDGVYVVKEEYPTFGQANSSTDYGSMTGEATVLTAKEFTGESAKKNADSLDYKTMWKCVENRTPILQSFSHYAKEETATLLGNTIDLYDIVISSEASTLTKMMAEYFQGIIYDETGALLDIITDVDAEREYEILFGDTTRTGSDVLYPNGKYNADTLGYTIKSVGNKIVIGYSDSSSLTGAYDAFLNLLTEDTTEGINVSGTYDAMTQVDKTGDIRVMSSNIYGKNAHDFDHLGMPWKARAEIMADVYKVYQPDFIGLQESTFEQEQELLKYIGDMYAVVPFAEADQNRTPLLYRKDLYKLEASYYYDFTGGRHLEWALYSSIENPDEKFIHMNLHYLPVGKTTDTTYETLCEQQEAQAQLVNAEIKSLMEKYPNVSIAVTGDYNNTSTSETYNTMINGIDIASGSVLLKNSEDSKWYTQRSLGKEILNTEKDGKEGPIDHVTITTDTLEAITYKVIHHPLACWGSDHYAIFLDMNTR